MGSDKSHTKLVLIVDYFLVKQHLNERESQKNSEDMQKHLQKYLQKLRKAVTVTAEFEKNLNLKRFFNCLLKKG